MSETNKKFFQHYWWGKIIIGLIFFGGAWAYYSYASEWEEKGGQAFMPRKMTWIYETLGKMPGTYGICAIGVIMVLVGLGQLLLEKPGEPPQDQKPPTPPV